MGKAKYPAGADEIGDRVRWLLDHRYGGSRSKMAAAIQVSLTGLMKVVSGDQQPGRRLIEKLVRHAGVRPGWLLTGEGHPFGVSAIPVSATCLPGPPEESAGQLSTEGVPAVGDLYSPSRYWLELGRAEPAVRAAASGFAAGDLMLMETDRGGFPPVERLGGKWAVVRVPGRGGKVVRLAELAYHREGEDGPAVLEAETFVHHPLRLRRLVVDELPDGTFEVSKRTVRLEQPKGDGADTAGRRPATASVLQHPIGREDVVALCVLLVRRFTELKPVG